VARRTCTSWRPVLLYPPGEHHPIGARPWWKPCRKQLTDTEWIRCRDCTLALANHPDPFVRLALVNEEPGSVDADIIHLLADDPDVMVALTAQAHQKNMLTRLRLRTRTGRALTAWRSRDGQRTLGFFRRQRLKDSVTHGQEKE